MHRQSPREAAVLKTDGTTRARAFEHSCNRVLAAHPLTHSDGGNPLDRLLESLGSWADAREVTGGIEVTFRRRAGGRRTVELVLTRPDVVVLMDIRMPGVSPRAGLRAADTGRSMRVEAFDRVRFSRE